jgi:hypothetical protein
MCRGDSKQAMACSNSLGLCPSTRALGVAPRRGFFVQQLLQSRGPARCGGRISGRPLAGLTVRHIGIGNSAFESRPFGDRLRERCAQFRFVSRRFC